jgi:hypothetical protein
MSYDFLPMTEEDFAASSIIEEGTYDFEVAKSTRKVSKGGNPMAEINIRVFDKEGNNHFVYDYLVFSKVPLNIKKVKHFCDTTGLQKEYKAGSLPEELEFLSGKVNIGIKDEQPREGGGVYPRKNYVLDYVGVSSKSNDITKVEETSENSEVFDDSIPF